MASSSEGFSAEQSRELEALFGNRLSKILKWFAIFAGFAALGVVLLVALTSHEQLINELHQAQAILLHTRLAWPVELVNSFDEKRNWLQDHGLGIEIAIFERLGTAIFSSAAYLQFDRTSSGFLPSAFVGLHFIILRVVFLLLAVWRLWAAAILAGALYARTRIHPHEEADMLGQTGNGSMYYSGILGHLNKVDEKGRPQLQVTGLACPRKAPRDQIEKSELYALLQDYEADNETNKALIGIILYYSTIPGYLAERDENRSADAVWSNLPLPEYAEHWLVTSLRLHAKLQDLSEGSGVEDSELEGAEPEGPFEASINAALYRVLTQTLRIEIARLPAAMIATLVLVHQAAKVMVYGFEGSRWTVKSRFPELCARAVMHSLPAFSQDYSTTERTWLRRALIFASRRSVFAPVRMPNDLSMETKALRNWSEIMLGSPQKLNFAADEVELVALLDEIHERWNTYFFDAIQRHEETLIAGAYASGAKLLFLPINSLVEAFGTIVKPYELDRLSALATFVAQKNKIETLSLPVAEENSSESKYFERLPVPLGFMEIKELSRRHDVSEDIVQRWSTYRMVLHSFGWLARRVGEYTVPESSLIFAIFETDPNAQSKSKEANAKGLIGRSGMIPLRVSRLTTRWGQNWSKSFRQVGATSMAETPEEYQRLLRGDPKPVPEDFSMPAS